MNNQIKTLDLPIPPLTGIASVQPFLTLLRVRQRTATGSRTPRPPGPVLGQGGHANSTRRPSEAPAVYAVDDVAGVTDLYRNLLEPTGYVVRVFNDRANALEALRTDRNRPALLITDYLGLSMPVDQFMHACRLVHPSLRILMASGFNRMDMRLYRARPDRFIQKPFRPDELQQEVKAALEAA